MQVCTVCSRKSVHTSTEHPCQLQGPCNSSPHPAATLPLAPANAVNVLKAVQGCPTVCRIYCATANPTGGLRHPQVGNKWAGGAMG